MCCMNKLAISTNERDEATIITLSGSAALGEASVLERHLQAVFSQGRYKLVIDLSGLDFTSSLGLGSLIRAHTRCREHAGFLFLVNPQPRVMKVFKTTHLDELFHIYAKVEEAIAAMHG